MNTRVNCFQGSCYRSPFLLPASNSMLISETSGARAGMGKMSAAVGYRDYFEAWVSAQRFRQKLAGHMAAICNQEANGLRQLRTCWMWRHRRSTLTA